MNRVLILLIAICATQALAIKGKNKTVQDVINHFNPIISELTLQSRYLSNYYFNETKNITKLLNVYPEDLSEKSAERGKLLQNEVKQLKSEAKSVQNYNEIYQKCRPQINKELDALHEQNESQNKECLKHLDDIQLFMNNTDLPSELTDLETGIQNITERCERFNKVGKVRKCFNNEINAVIKPQLRKLEEDIDIRLQVVRKQFPTLIRPFMECSFALNDNIVHGLREITVRNLRKCIKNNS